MSTKTKTPAKGKRNAVADVAAAVAQVSVVKALAAAEALAIPITTRPLEQINVQMQDLAKQIDDCHYGDERKQLRLEADRANLQGELAINEALGEKPIDAAIPDPSLREVAIDQIVIDPANPNHRLQSMLNDAETVRLANNIKAIRLQQPIAVMVEGKTYTLIFGHRRLAAHLLNKADTISAMVYPKLTAEQIRAIKAAENLQRKDLNPIEEAIAICQILESVTGDKELTHDERVAKAASYLGKSESWVRDRAYLARLTGDTRQLVIDGRLPLLHARELAKVADEDIRDRLAHGFARDEDGTGGRDIDHVRRCVQEHQNSLTLAPWKLDVKFAGKPACSTCPFNSANDVKLFEHDNQPEKPQCLSPACYKHKQDAAEKEIALTVKGVSTLHKKGKLTITENGMAEHLPKAIKPAVVVRRTKKALDPEAAKKGITPSGKKAEGPSPEEKARKVAQEAWYKLRDAHEKEMDKLLGKLLTPGRLIAIAVMDALGFFNAVQTWQNNKSVTKFLTSKNGKACLSLLKSEKGPSMTDLLKLVRTPDDIGFQARMNSHAWPDFLKAMGAKPLDPLISQDDYVAAELKRLGFTGKIEKPETPDAKEDAED